MGFGTGKEGRRGKKKSLPFACLKHSCAFSTETDMQYVCGIKISRAGATRKIVSAKAPGGWEAIMKENAEKGSRPGCLTLVIALGPGQFSAAGEGGSCSLRDFERRPSTAP